MPVSPILSLVIPCYNEAGNLPRLIERCEQAFAGQDVEVVLVDNGSKDETESILKSRLSGHAFIRSVRVPVNQGYGFGILSGLKAAKGTYLAWTHADLQADPADVLKVMPELKAGTQALFKGRRHGRALKDLVFEYGMAAFETLVLTTPLIDINAQPNIFPRTFLNELNEAPNDFAFDLYVYYLAKRRGLSLHRFPVHFGKRTAGQAHLDSLAAKLRYSKRTIGFTISLLKKIS